MAAQKKGANSTYPIDIGWRNITHWGSLSVSLSTSNAVEGMYDRHTKIRIYASEVNIVE